MAPSNKDNRNEVIVEETIIIDEVRTGWYYSWWAKSLIVIVAAVFFSSAIVAGYYWGLQRGYSETKNINITGIENGATPSNVSVDFSPFWQEWNLLKTTDLNATSVSDQQLLYGAMTGLANAYNDPYTVFFDPSDATSFLSDVQGNFGGIGAQIGSKAGQIIIIAPIKGTPAAAAGLEDGDVILDINSSSTANMSVDEAVGLIRGTAGTNVNLTISRSSWANPKVITITRAVINIPTVNWSMEKGNIAYIQLEEFDSQSAQLFSNAVTAALAQGAKGIVIDLRDDPGGYLDQAVDIAGWFATPGTTVVKERYANGSETVIAAQGNASLKGFPTVILINGGSASASEILSGALRDDDNVKLIGTQSFGKGVVQQVTQFPDGSALKITVAEWLLPDGSEIEHVGLTPDYIVPLTATDTATGVDPQLAKALQVVAAEIAAK